LDRAPDAPGLSFWANAIASHQLTLGDAALAIAAGAQANKTPQGLLDAQTLANKAAIASEFTADVSDTLGVTMYSGANAAQIGRNLLSGVNSATVLSGFVNNVLQAVSTLETPSPTPTPTP